MIDPTKIVCRFFVEAVQNATKTREANRPIFDERELVELRIPGNTKQIAVHLAHEIANPESEFGPAVTYAELFSKNYKMFKDGHTSQVSGTPLDELTVLNVAKKSELRAIGIPTVEALAAVNDANLKKLGPDARIYREQAQAYLAAAADTAPLAAMAAQIAALQAQLADRDAPVIESAPDDYGDLTDDDIKGMIRDAGGDVPRGRAGRDTLLAALVALAPTTAEVHEAL